MHLCVKILRFLTRSDKRWFPSQGLQFAQFSIQDAGEGRSMIQESMLGFGERSIHRLRGVRC
jgi:hypothetical protein